MSDGKNKNPDDQPEDNRDGFERFADFISDGFNRLGNYKPGSETADARVFFRHARNNDVAAITKMLDDGFDVTTHNMGGQTALHMAAQHNAVDVMSALLDRGMDPLAGMRDMPKRTAIDVAVDFGRAEAVTLLAKRGGLTPQATGLSGIHRACEKGKAGVVKALIAAGVDCNAVDDGGVTPLIVALRAGQKDVAATLLALPDVVSAASTAVAADTGRTALHYAAARGALDLVKLMGTAARVDLDRPDNKGDTPLLLTVKNGHVDIIRYLAGQGVDMNRVIGDETPLMCAIGAAAAQEVVPCLLSLGADPELRVGDRATTPLIAAVQARNIFAVRALLTAKADPKKLDSLSRSALFYARTREMRDIVAVLEDSLRNRGMHHNNPKPRGGI